MKLSGSHADSLEALGFSLIPELVPASLGHSLLEAAKRDDSDGLFRVSGVGQGATQTTNVSIRGDRIRWWSEGTGEPNPARRELCERLRKLQASINESLYLGISDFELHDAIYEEGAHYAEHLDTFRSDDRRMLSLVIYLQDDWRPENGGHLELTDLKGQSHRLLPIRQNTVLFLSREIRHGVSPTLRRRHSIACWFRVRPQLNR